MHGHTINPFVRELVDAVLADHGHGRNLFAIPSGMSTRSRDPVKIDARSRIYADCITRKTRFGNTPSAIEIAADLGVCHSIVLSAINRAAMARSKHAKSAVGDEDTSRTVDNTGEAPYKNSNGHEENGISSHG